MTKENSSATMTLNEEVSWEVCLKTLLAFDASKKPNFCGQDTDPFSFLWMVKRDPPSYLFGTIHVPYTRVWDHIPENAKQAFQTCSLVFFELDLMDPETVSAMSTCQMLPQGKNLSDVLPKDLYDRLKKHLEYVKDMMPQWMTEDQKGRGMYADYLFKAIAGNWERKRPVWVMLMVNYLTESDVRSRGVPVLDLYLAQEAVRLKKKTGAIEKVEEQCLPLNGLNLPQVVFALNHTLQQHEELRESDIQSSYTTDDLIRHYNCGDLDTVIFNQDTTQVPNLVNTTLTEEDAAVAKDIDMYFQQELIYKRNIRMATRVAELIEKNTEQSLFFAFGAGHFLGNNTVLDYLEGLGYQVVHIPVRSKLDSKRPKSSPRTSALVKSLLRASGAIGGKDLKARSVQPRKQTRRKAAATTENTQPHATEKSTNVVTARPRLFNDLWIRLDNYRKTSQLHEHNVDMAGPIVRNIQRRTSPGALASCSSSAYASSVLFSVVVLRVSFRIRESLSCNCGIAFSGIT